MAPHDNQQARSKHLFFSGHRIFCSALGLATDLVQILFAIQLLFKSPSKLPLVIWVDQVDTNQRIAATRSFVMLSRPIWETKATVGEDVCPLHLLQPHGVANASPSLGQAGFTVADSEHVGLEALQLLTILVFISRLAAFLMRLLGRRRAIKGHCTWISFTHGANNDHGSFIHENYHSINI